MSMSKPDVIVIGAGVVGIATAYYAARSGARVLLIERNRVGRGSSYGNAGLLVPSHCAPLCAPGMVRTGVREMLDPDGIFYVHPRPDFQLGRWLLAFRRNCNERHYRHGLETHARLNRLSLQCHLQLAALGGEQYHFQQRGQIAVFAKRETLEEGIRYAERVRSLGMIIDVLSESEIRKREPSLSLKLAGGLLHTHDGCFEPYSFVTWFARQSTLQGVRILEQTQVYGFDLEQGKVGKVVTTRGSFAASQVVVAAGAWTPWLAALVGWNLPITAAKGYSITHQDALQAPRYPLLLEEAHTAVTPMGDRTRFAGTLELAGIDETINRRRVDTIRSRAGRFLKQASRWPVEEVWAGLRPLCSDDLPVVGRLEGYSNLFVAAGHGTKGISQGPGTGRLMSDLLGGKAVGALGKALDPNRFR